MTYFKECHFLVKRRICINVFMESTFLWKNSVHKISRKNRGFSLKQVKIKNNLAYGLNTWVTVACLLSNNGNIKITSAEHLMVLHIQICNLLPWYATYFRSGEKTHIAFWQWVFILSAWWPMITLFVSNTPFTVTPTGLSLQ